ncbi:MAG: T9SS type A sorting domain-containing protein, partial [Moheibacter sp.]
EPDRDIHLYPNPVDNMLYILGKNEMTYLAILDIQGRKIAEYFPNSINTSIHTDNLKSGIYLVQIYSERKTHTYKIIKN